MIDRIFFIALTFCLIVTGALAVRTAVFGAKHLGSPEVAAAAPTRIVQLERVVVVGKRLAPAAAVASTEAGSDEARTTTGAVASAGATRVE